MSDSGDSRRLGLGVTVSPTASFNERLEVMIYAKTYPELSVRHRETVCTGGVRLDTGAPVRLYPVPLRYMDGDKQYRLYDVIRVDASRNSNDPRPESLKIDQASLEKIGNVGPDKHQWAERRKYLDRDTSWHFDSMPALHAERVAGRRTLAMMNPYRIISVSMEEKGDDSEAAHRDRWERITGQQDLFPREYKELQYIPVTYRIQWQCAGG